MSEGQRQFVATSKLPKLAHFYQEEAVSRGHRFQDLNEPFADEDWSVAAGLSVTVDRGRRPWAKSTPEKPKRKSPPPIPLELPPPRSESVVPQKRKQPDIQQHRGEPDTQRHHGESDAQQQMQTLAQRMQRYAMNGTELQDLYRANPQLVRYRLVTTDPEWRDAWHTHGHRAPVPGIIFNRDFDTIATHMHLGTAFKEAERADREPISPQWQKTLEEKVYDFNKSEVALNHIFFEQINDSERLHDVISQGARKLEARNPMERAFVPAQKEWMLQHGVRTPDDLQRLLEQQRAEEMGEESTTIGGTSEDDMDIDDAD